MKVTAISSLANPQLKAFKHLATDNSGYKKTGLIWLEGSHLCDAYWRASAASQMPMHLEKLVASESAWHHWGARLHSAVQAGSREVLLLPDSLMLQWSPLPITQAEVGIGCVVRLPLVQPVIDSNLRTVVLDRVQDAGNVGSILRSCAVFGIQQVVALHGCAALWSPKVLRAAMGAHFSLQLIEDVSESDLSPDLPLWVTSSHQGEFLHEINSHPPTTSDALHHVWVFGHEGQGVSHSLMQRAAQLVRIRQSGQESLNVAAAVAVCLYATA